MAPYVRRILSMLTLAAVASAEPTVVKPDAPKPTLPETMTAVANALELSEVSLPDTPQSTQQVIKLMEKGWFESTGESLPTLVEIAPGQPGRHSLPGRHTIGSLLRKLRQSDQLSHWELVHGRLFVYPKQSAYLSTPVKETTIRAASFCEFIENLHLETHPQFSNPRPIACMYTGKAGRFVSASGEGLFARPSDPSVGPTYLVNVFAGDRIRDVIGQVFAEMGETRFSATIKPMFRDRTGLPYTWYLRF